MNRIVYSRRYFVRTGSRESFDQETKRQITALVLPNGLAVDKNFAPVVYRIEVQE